MMKVRFEVKSVNYLIASTIIIINLLILTNHFSFTFELLLSLFIQKLRNIRVGIFKKELRERAVNYTRKAERSKSSP